MRHSSDMKRCYKPPIGWRATLCAAGVVVVTLAQLFSLDKLAELPEVRQIAWWLPLLLMVNAMAVFSLPYILRIKTSGGLQKAARVCTMLLPVGWLAMLVTAWGAGAKAGMFGVYFIDHAASVAVVCVITMLIMAVVYRSSHRLKKT